jgi:hypothetical protein
VPVVLHCTMIVRFVYALGCNTKWLSWRCIPYPLLLAKVEVDANVGHIIVCGLQLQSVLQGKKERNE